jgi:outer membrane protein OmpA-like peptidoglycan-associated protein
MSSMRPRSLLLASLSVLAACASPTAGGPSRGAAGLAHAPELGAVRCLVLAPFENASDTALAADAATDGLLASIDPARARVFPVPELRTLFRDTPLELPVGISPSLALELAELLGADAALYGAVEGRGGGDPSGGELLVTVRLALSGNRRLLFAGTAPVKAAPGERSDEAVRRTTMELAAPALSRIGDPGRKHCFEADRTRALRELALAEAKDAAPGPAKSSTAAAVAAVPAAVPTPVPAAAAGPAAVAAATEAATVPASGADAAKAVPPAVSVAAPAPAPAPAAAPPRPQPRTPRQAAWARTLGDGGRLLVEDLAFEGRTATLVRDAGLADLAAALASTPDARVRVEAFVDSTSDREADARLSVAMAQAATDRLVRLGVDPARVTASGRGSDRPLLPNFTARGRAANRRVEVTSGP